MSPRLSVIVQATQPSHRTGLRKSHSARKTYPFHSVRGGAIPLVKIVDVPKMARGTYSLHIDSEVLFVRCIPMLQSGRAGVTESNAAKSEW